MPLGIFFILSTILTNKPFLLKKNTRKLDLWVRKKVDLWEGVHPLEGMFSFAQHTEYL
jgi:hypothetical protein